MLTCVLKPPFKDRSPNYSFKDWLSKFYLVLIYLNQLFCFKTSLRNCNNPVLRALMKLSNKIILVTFWQKLIKSFNFNILEEMKQFNGRQVDYNILIFKFSHLKTSTTLLHFYYFQYYITQAHSSTSYQLSVSHI